MRHALKSFAVAVLLPQFFIASAASSAETEIVSPERHPVCRHYVNRARFMPRTGDVDIVAVLADACAEALRAHHDPSRLDRNAARDFLETLSHARADIAAINRDRAAALDDRSTASIDTAHRDLDRALRLVSPAGEYLILRASGALDALERWRPSVALDGSSRR